MSKDRDIDDILDSLNQLLREGESHNDDHVEAEGAEIDDALLPELEHETSEADDIEEMHADEEVTEEVAGQTDEVDEANEERVEEGVEEEESDTAESAVLPTTQEHSNDDSEPVADDQESLTVQRVVLTEDMLVDNPQGSLLSLVQDSMAKVDSETDSNESHEADEKSQLSLDQNLMTELMDHVTDDVIQALQQQLPLLIQNSLEKHLDELRKPENPDNVPEQTEE